MIRQSMTKGKTWRANNTNRKFLLRPFQKIRQKPWTDEPNKKLTQFGAWNRGVGGAEGPPHCFWGVVPRDRCPEGLIGNVPSATTTTESLMWWIIRCYISSLFSTSQHRNATTPGDFRCYIRCRFEVLLLPFRWCWTEAQQEPPPKCSRHMNRAWIPGGAFRFSTSFCRLFTPEMDSRPIDTNKLCTTHVQCTEHKQVQDIAEGQEPSLDLSCTPLPRGRAWASEWRRSATEFAIAIAAPSLAIHCQYHLLRHYFQSNSKWLKSSSVSATVAVMNSEEIEVGDSNDPFIRIAGYSELQSPYRKPRNYFPNNESW